MSYLLIWLSKGIFSTVGVWGSWRPLKTADRGCIWLVGRRSVCGRRFSLRPIVCTPTPSVTRTVPLQYAACGVIQKCYLYAFAFVSSRNGRREKSATSWTTWFCLTRRHTTSCTKRCRATNSSLRPSSPNDWRYEDLWPALRSKSCRLKVGNVATVLFHSFDFFVSWFILLWTYTRAL